MPQVWDLGNGINVPDLLALRQQADVRKVRQSLTDLAPTDYATGAQRLLAAGDVTGANSLAGLDQSREARLFREEEARRSQSNADRSYGFQAAEAGRAQQNADRSFALAERNAASKGYDIRVVKDPDGSSRLVRVDLSKGTAEPIDGSAGAAGGAGGSINPYYTGKFNAEQGKAGTYADRMAASHKIISGLENINQGAGGVVGGVASNILPDMAMNAVASADRQKIIQAQRDFLNAILRRESGAAISSGEFANGRSQYFPQPGDTPEVLAQKRANRETALAGIMREAGPSYKPPAGFTGPTHMGNGEAAASPPQTGQGAPAPAAGAAPDLSNFHRNAQTGEVIGWDGKQWVKVQ